MPRPFFPHTPGDVTRAVDGGLGLVVGDMADGLRHGSRAVTCTDSGKASRGDGHGSDLTLVAP